MRPQIPLVMVKGAYDSVGGPESLLHVIAESIDRNRFPPLLALLARPRETLPRILADLAEQMPSERLDWHGLAAAPLTAKYLAALLADRPGAILHTNDMRSNLLGWMIRRVRRVPWIAHVHGWLGNTHSGRHRLYEEVDRRLVPGADLVLVGSNAMAEEVSRAGARRVGIVTNGVAADDPAAYAEQGATIRDAVAPSGGLVVGVLGRLHPGKGQALLIEAVARLRAQGLDVTALVVGDGPADAQYRELAANLGMAEHVHFAGLVPEVRPWLAAMDMLCIPSLKDSMPMTAMEAMSIAVPVIASRVGELPVAIEHGVSGLIVEVGSVPSLVAAIGRLAGSPEERVRFGQAGRRRLIQHYSPNAMMRQLEGFCEELAREAERGT
ncbi:glycosyltransferase family 4 protein [Roseomonas sp. HJA6]|uniref:Glycosyltransferase family 4 protein n=1 Tax=Roseomonas alba TaxID=2846776 RepID=A0ABS7A2V3_9PROT|nr:glycosyltransferase family 4 protein [Neoroseomonas alba]MBW6396488.1 glycosyltransferase family 4 protein [Neoroseomonas alba]